jgi:hypothetical protein
MHECDTRERAELAAIDEALRTYPLVPAPPTLAPAVLARVQAQTLAPRFRLGWIDYALGLFGTSMAGLVLLFGQVLLPDGLPSVLLSSVGFTDAPSIVFWIVIGLGGLVLLAGCLVVAAVALAPRSLFQLKLKAGRV